MCFFHLFDRKKSNMGLALEQDGYWWLNLIEL